ncbi:MAG: hypothetical protein E7649_06965 [Ruminococcaceae bacterium]|nr:hypothetical protein [Oscillospiraceae bacterium]
MKKILYYIMAAILVVCLFTLPAFATGTITESVTESVAESLSESASVTYEELTQDIFIDNEAASEIVGIIEGSDSKTQAILDIAERLGITYEEAEGVLNTFLEVGDKYLGENELWIGFKRDVSENLKFWVIVVACALSVLTIIVMIFIQVAKTNPMMRKSMFGTDKAIGICQTTQKENSQALGEMKVLYAEAIKKETVYQKLIAEKEGDILELEKKIKCMEESAQKEKTNMVLAESYNLQILKLICSRTALPLSDRAAIDLWYTRATESLKSELSPEDIAKIDTIAAVIEKGDGDGDK